MKASSSKPPRAWPSNSIACPEAKWYAQEAWFRRVRDGEVLVLMLTRPDGLPGLDQEHLDEAFALVEQIEDPEDRIRSRADILAENKRFDEAIAIWMDMAEDESNRRDCQQDRSRAHLLKKDRKRRHGRPSGLPPREKLDEWL